MSGGKIIDLGSQHDNQEYSKFVRKYSYKVVETEGSKGVNSFWYVAVDDIVFGFRDASAARVMEASTPKDSMTVFIPMSNNGSIINGAKVDSGMVFIAPKDEIRLLSPPNYSHYFFNLPTRYLVSYLGETAAEIIFRNLRKNYVRFSAVSGKNDARDEVAFVGRRIDDLSKCNNMLIPQENHLKSYLIEIVGKTFDNPIECDNVPVSLRVRARLKLVDRALEAIQNSAPQSSVLEISEKSHCSLRTLEYAFKETMGLSPKSFIKKRRLECIHQELMFCYNLECAKAILSKYGVMNYSRFKAEYSSVFNEYPEQTVGKSGL